MINANTILSAVALLASAVNAHISLAQPVPYGKPDTSPLSPSGSNYPCKTENGFTINSVTNMAVGSSQQLAFSGTAVHGGGSCQLSLTKGYQPNANSPFKVIYSIEGGCPGVDGGTSSYSFKIPSEVPDGEYTLAWTWFNRIGNREMYMNCAPIKVTGGAKDESQYNALPDMAIYNIASKNSCKTTETTDVQFPNPGKYVQTGSGFKPSDPTGCGGSSGTSGSGSTGSSGSTGTSGNAGNANAGNSGTGTSSANNGQYTGLGSNGGNNNPAPASPSTAASAPKAAPSGSFAEGSTGSNSPAPAAPAPAAPSPAAAAPQSGSSTPGGTCSPDGSVVCSSDGSQYGLCNWGKVIFQSVAAGTKCAGGQIRKRQEFRA